MRFFTPDLFSRFNSADEDVADRADADWERALRRYQSHLKKLAPKLSPSVRKLTKLDLHDADIVNPSQGAASPVALGPNFPMPFPFSVRWAVFVLRQPELEIMLTYELSDRPRTHAPPPDWPFSGERPHWLYDEVDLAPHRRDGFVHRVLVSDGTVVETPFNSLTVHVAPIATTGGQRPARTA